MSLSFGSQSVPTSAAVLDPSLVSASPGSLVLYNAGPNAITIGGSGVTAGKTGPGFATIGPGNSVPIPLVGGFAPGGKLFAVAVTGASVLNWFIGTAAS